MENAAIKIQKVWRGCRLYNAFKLIKMRREVACRRIQRFWKKFKILRLMPRAL